MNKLEYDPAVPLTELQAVELTWEMWHWLWEHPMMDKHDFLKRKMPQAVGEVANDCFCCQYVGEKAPKIIAMHRGFGCANGDNPIEICPLRKLWPNGCQGEGSPYSDWLDTEPTEAFKGLRWKAAARIFDACEEKLAEFYRCETVKETNP